MCGRVVMSACIGNVSPFVVIEIIMLSINKRNIEIGIISHRYTVNEWIVEDVLVGD